VKKYAGRMECFDKTQLIKVMVDSNVIISTVTKIEGIPAKALFKSANYPFTLILTDTMLKELTEFFTSVLNVAKIRRGD
jgi:predicted nucleic acid-binding protein